MKHAAVRRFSLLFAGISFSLLTALIMTVHSLNIVDPSFMDDVLGHNKNDVPAFSQETVTFPYRIEGTPLIIEAVCAYSGPFYEDGTGREVADIISVKVHNDGTKMVLYGLIELHFKNQTLLFEVTRIPPKTTVLIPEKNASTFTFDMPTQCCGWTIDKSYILRQDVEILQCSDGSLSVTNKSNKDIKGLNIYHKEYSVEGKCHIGGIAHRTFILELKAGQSITVEKKPDNSSILFYE